MVIKSFEGSSNSENSDSGSDQIFGDIERRAESMSNYSDFKRMGTSIASEELLFEPRIYANRLLGKKINLKDVVIMKNVNGKIVSTIVPKDKMGTITSK